MTSRVLRVGPLIIPIMRSGSNLTDAYAENCSVGLGPGLVKDMQAPPIPQKESFLFFWSKLFRNFFFVRFLVFKIWSNLYSTVVNSDLGTCELISEARVLNPKACGVQRHSSEPECFLKFLLSPECITKVKFKIDYNSKTKNRT